jgi:hypothetical protein
MLNIANIDKCYYLLKYAVYDTNYPLIDDNLPLAGIKRVIISSPNCKIYTN